MVGGATTVTVAVAVFPVPKAASDTVTLFTFVPSVTPVTFTPTVHEPPPAGKVAPESETVPGRAATASPVHVFDRLLGLAITKPAGSVSVKLTLVSAFVAVIVNVRLVVPLSGITGAPNAFVMVGGVPTTSVAVAVFPVTVAPVSSCAVIAEVVLTLAPPVVPVTCTETVQEAFAASDEVLTPIFVEPEFEPVMVAPEAQVVAPLTGFASCTPAGNASLNATFVRAAFPAVIVNVSVETPLTAIVLGVKDLVMDGFAVCPKLTPTTLRSVNPRNRRFISPNSFPAVQTTEASLSSRYKAVHTPQGLLV